MEDAIFDRIAKIFEVALEPSWTTVAARVALVVVILASSAQLALAASTVWLAQYPVRKQHLGFLYELQLLFLFVKKHTKGVVVSQPLSNAEFSQYDRGREVAKNVFFSLIFFGMTVVVVVSAFVSYRRDPDFSNTDLLLLLISSVIATVQLRIYDSERKIYNGKVFYVPFTTAPEEVSAPPREGADALGSGLQQESAMSAKPIYQRVNPESFARTATEASKNIDELIEADKRKTEEALVKSKWSKMFELSGAPAKDQK